MIGISVLPASVLSVMERFDRAGMEVYCVGGCVRDLLRGTAPHDFDLCTAAHPDTVRALFADVPCLETGIRHGTVTVLWEGQPFEITTYRVDGAYDGHRRPRSVTFTPSLQEDCRRRDFTVNAMAYHPVHGLSDFFGGTDDLQARIIRCVGDADTRFSEDALRILRALRFSACLDFTVEAQTAAALHRGAPLLRHISGERIVSEWKKLLSGHRVPALLTEYRDVISVFFPFFHAFSDPTAFGRICDAAADSIARMAGLLYLCGIREAEAARAALAHLPFDRAFTDGCARLCSLTADPVPLLRYTARRMLSEAGDAYMTALKLHAAVIPEDMAAAELAAALCQDSIAQNDPLHRDALAVTGRDLLACGYSGRAVGDMLDQLLDAVMRDAVPNTYDALISWAAAARKTE